MHDLWLEAHHTNKRFASSRPIRAIGVKSATSHRSFKDAPCQKELETDGLARIARLNNLAVEIIDRALQAYRTGTCRGTRGWIRHREILVGVE